jgi:hypothetical protein
MALDTDKVARLLDYAYRGQVTVCGYWAVTWDPTDATATRYYSDAKYSEMLPFHGVGVDIEPRVMGNIIRDTEFEMNADLRTETIPITFDDIDKDITQHFQEFGSGIRCELFFYYPQVDLTQSMWFGQLQAPPIYGHKVLQTTATNGFRSREQSIPKRLRPRECTANFGGNYTSEFALESNGCPYDRHLGGTLGNLDPATGEAYLGCPRLTNTDCRTRLPFTPNGDYFLGFSTDASATVTDPRSGYVAVTKGNASILKTPIRAIAGTKYVRALPLLLWRREANASTPDHGFVRGIWEIGEGPVSSIYNIKVMEKIIEQIHLEPRVGDIFQGRTNYASNVSNFSGTAHFSAAYGWIDPLSVTAPQLQAECNVIGYRDVAVWSDEDTYIRQWTDDRIWWLLELYTNVRFGLGYPPSRFTISDWVDASEWGRETVSFTLTSPDNEQNIYSGRRTTFDAVLEGRPIAEQVEDICRSGAISVPFQHEGRYTVSTFGIAESSPDAPLSFSASSIGLDEAVLVWTAAEETIATRVFTDAGDAKNIEWANGQPSIYLSQTPDDRIVNEIVLTFEEANNYDVERPITVDHPDQKLKAGRILGENNLQSVPKRFSAFGVRGEQEAVRLGYRLLKFGEFDEGGVDNNLRAQFTTPMVHALGLRRFDVIKVVSTLLDNFLSPTGDQFEYFRILAMKKTGGGFVEIIAQAYNHLAYTAFEATAGVPGGPNPGDPPPLPPDTPPDPPGPYPDPCTLTFGAVSYDAANGKLNVPIPPC